MKKIILSLTFVLFSVSMNLVYGGLEKRDVQTSDLSVYSVQKVISLSLENSSELKAMSYEVEAAQISVEQSKNFQNPTLTFQTGEVHSGGQGGRVYDFTVNQHVPLFGKRKLLIEQKSFLERLKTLDQRELELEISHGVYNKVVYLSALQEMESHLSERKKRFSLIQKSLLARPLVSPKEKVDRDLIESQINLLSLGMTELVLEKSKILHELRQLSGTEIGAVEFYWDKEIDSMNKNFSKKESLLLLEKSLSYQKIFLEDELSQSDHQLSRYMMKPEIYVGLNYRRENVSPSNDFYHAQVSLSLPLWDQGQKIQQISRAQRMNIKAHHEHRKKILKLSLHQLYSSYEYQKSLLQIFKLRDLKKWEKKYLEAESSFKKGLIDALTFLQVDKEAHENIDQIYFCRVSFLKTLSRLKLLMGKKPGNS